MHHTHSAIVKDTRAEAEVFMCKGDSSFLSDASSLSKLLFFCFSAVLACKSLSLLDYVV